MTLPYRSNLAAWPTPFQGHLQPHRIALTYIITFNPQSTAVIALEVKTMDFILRFQKGDYLALALILPAAAAILVTVAMLRMNGYTGAWATLTMTLTNPPTS